MLLENKINVAIGMRRTGKTYFIFQKIAQLIQAGVSLTDILYINLEDDRLLPLTRSKLAGLLDAFLAFSVPLYSESIRKVRVNPKKIYAIDTGLVRAMTLDHTKDLGRLFENLIYLDLRRQGAKIYYYLTKERYEVDFLVHTREGKKELIQVTWDMTDPETKQREERALAAAMAELKVPGRIVTLDAYLRDGLQL